MGLILYGPTIGPAGDKSICVSFLSLMIIPSLAWLPPSDAYAPLVDPMVGGYLNTYGLAFSMGALQEVNIGFNGQSTAPSI